MYHEWSDDHFDWSALHRAQNFIHWFCRPVLKVWTKEKYGTIRYEFTYMWGWANSKYLAKLQLLWFHVALWLACLRYRHIAGEIVEDWSSQWATDTKHYIPLLFRVFVKTNSWRYSHEERE